MYMHHNLIILILREWMLEWAVVEQKSTPWRLIMKPSASGAAKPLYPSLGRTACLQCISWLFIHYSFPSWSYHSLALATAPQWTQLHGLYFARFCILFKPPDIMKPSPYGTSWPPTGHKCMAIYFAQYYFHIPSPYPTPRIGLSVGSSMTKFAVS